MPRPIPNTVQNLFSGLVLPLLSVALLPISLTAVALCIANDKIRKHVGGSKKALVKNGKYGKKGCVIISGGRMTKGLT